MSSFMENLRKRARANLKTIVLAEGYDERHVKAASILKNDKTVKRVILLGDRTTIESLAKDNSLVLDDFVTIIDPKKDKNTDAYIERLYNARKHKGMTEDQARDLIENKTVYTGAAIVANGEADGMVGGAVYPTGEMIRATLFLIGLKIGLKTLSSVFFMESPDKSMFTDGVFCFADCAVIPNPSPEQLADIAESTVHSYKALVAKEEPRVALLSFSTKGSAKDSLADKVIEAKKILDSRNVDFIYDGEIQFDASILPNVCEKKAPGSPLHGKANIFIFPDLNAGNICYKVAERIGKCTAIGPMLQGAAKPANDLSRGCSAQDIADVSVLTSLQS